MKLKKIITAAITVIIAASSFQIYAGASYKNRDIYWSEEQKAYADKIAQMCIDEYDTYGCLPSMCVAQGWVESHLGETSQGFNFWGINAGKTYFPTLEEGVHAYMRVINNGWYPTAPFELDPPTLIRKLLEGGYDTPNQTYYDIIDQVYALFSLRDYDLPILEMEAQRNSPEKRKYKCYYDPSLKPNEIKVDSTILTKSSYSINSEQLLVYGGAIGYTIITGKQELDGKWIILDKEDQ